MGHEACFSPAQPRRALGYDLYQYLGGVCVWRVCCLPARCSLVPAASARSLRATSSTCSAARCHLATAHRHSLLLPAAAARCRCLLLLKPFVLHERRFGLRLWQDTRNLSITLKGVAIRHPHFASQCTKSFVLHERRFGQRLWQDTRNLSITSKGVAIRYPRFASQCTSHIPLKHPSDHKPKAPRTVYELNSNPSQ